LCAACKKDWALPPYQARPGEGPVAWGLTVAVVVCRVKHHVHLASCEGGRSS
jgi:hypothetical protein